MRPVSQRWLDAIRGSHQAVFQVLVCAPGQSGTSPTGVEIPIEDGDVQFDTESDILATCEIRVPDLDLYPRDQDALLAPYGNELYIRRGIHYGGGATEWVGLGYFRITAVEQDDARGGPLRVSGADRMRAVIKAGGDPQGFSKVQTYGEVLDILTRRYTGGGMYVGPIIEWEVTGVRDQQIGRQIALDGDRYGLLNDLITGANLIWHFDYRGHLLVRIPPALRNPVWTVDAGPNGVLVSMGESLSDEGVYNGAFVQGGSPDDSSFAPSSLFYDNDPNSPTYYFGPFGQVLLSVDEPLATSASKTNGLARLLVQASIGLPRQVDFAAVPNAALEPWDPILIRDPKGREDVHIIRRLTIPLSTSRALTGETRQYASELPEV